MNTALLLLRRLLEQVPGATEPGAEGRHLLVLDSEGMTDLPHEVPTATITWPVWRVGTELALRHRIWASGGAPLIAVLPERVAQSVQRAPDLLRRAHRQRIHTLSISDVLEVVLGVRVVGADAPHLEQLALAHLEPLSMAMGRRTLPTVVDRKMLTELLLDACVGAEVRQRKPSWLLAKWVQTAPRFDNEVTKLLVESLPVLHGDEGRLLAWALAEPEARLAALVVHGAVLTVEAAELPQPVWGPFWAAATAPPVQLDRRILRRALVRLAEETLEALGDDAASLLAQADKLGRNSLTPELLQTSRVLPLAFANRCETLARRAADGHAVSASEIAWLASHRAAAVQSDTLTVIEAMARISRYLDLPPVPPADLLAKVLDYQRNGAFADWAAMQLQRALASHTEHLEHAQRLLTRYRARRDRENLAFAEQLSAGYEAALHREGLTPLHRLWKRVVAPLWQREPSARLLLVVLDGCSYPVFLDLLDSLARDRKAPMGVQALEDGRAHGLPALSPLPTITSHARGAIFLGELPNDPLVAETVFRDQDEARTDKARFKQNEAMGQRTRRLFLKGDLGDGGKALEQAVADEALDVVGVVFNAVDDQIGSSNTGAPLRVPPESITAFLPALRAAHQTGRRVLLTADHGHSPYVNKSLRMGAGKTPRYLTVGNPAEVPEGYLEIELAGLGGPPERRAFAWRMGAYLGAPQVGFHGGCSLEEMVVPMAWIERDGLPADAPTWWAGQQVSPPPATSSVIDSPAHTPHLTPALRTRPDPYADAPKPQLSLLDPVDRFESIGLPKVLNDKLTPDEKAILLLLHDAKTARATDLATHLNKNAGRINGLMRNLRRTLHAEGLRRFDDEILPSGETMYRWVEGRS